MAPEAYNYEGYIIQACNYGWEIYNRYKKVAGPFATWIEAEEYIDDFLGE